MKQIGRYTVEDIPIGSGGMGHIFRGVNPEGKPVAIKEILPTFVSDLEYRSRIEREIEFLKMLNNDHVVRIYDHFEEGGNLYIVMELVDGLNVEQHVAQHGAIPWQDAVRYMIQLLDTMQDVHAHGIIHRDIKPGNIMIRPDGRICLLDFGVAKDNTAVNSSGGTIYGTVIGTDGYMSPEQAQGMSIDHRSDIYGLGCVLYFMLTGSHAFNSQNSQLSMTLAITHEQFPRLKDKKKDLPSKLQKILDSAVDKNMMTRFQSCGEFRKELQTMIPGAAGAGTHINTGNVPRDVTVSIGRENCDVCVGSDNMKVSRHHADITLKRFTGGEFFVYKDCSSNGTSIDGHYLTRGMSYNIPKGSQPIIYLANDPGCRLDINLVAAELERKSHELAADDSAAPAHGGSTPPPTPGPRPKPQRPEKPRNSSNNDPNTFFGAVKSCFSKYAVFSGRASRSEYWFFTLFNILISIVFLPLALFLSIDGLESFAMVLMAMMGIYSVAIILPSLAVFVRRLHDTDRSGWWSFIGLIPFGGIVLLIFLCQAGDIAENSYGEPPY